MNTLQQELPKRFTDAVSKLYNAFHENRLNPNDACACAVGNMCDNDSRWSKLVGMYGSGEVSDNAEDVIYGRKLTDRTGYNPIEIVTIEKVFLRACGWRYSNNHRDKNLQFKGLCAVVKYLCELDNVSNVMDFTSLFETQNDKPVKELQFV